MLRRTSGVLIAGIVFLALIAQTAVADQNIYLPLSDDNPYHDKSRPILIHLIMINVTEKPIYNINPPENSENLKWVHLVYSFENVGDMQIKAYIKVAFVDSNGVEYQNDREEYTGESVLPHRKTDPKFVEVPVPRNAQITQFIIRQGFYETPYIIPEMTPILSPAASKSPSLNLTSQPGATMGGIDGCLPFIPFGMAGGLAAVGMVVNRSGIRKR